MTKRRFPSIALLALGLVLLVGCQTPPSTRIGPDPATPAVPTSTASSEMLTESPSATPTATEGPKQELGSEPTTVFTSTPDSGPAPSPTEDLTFSGQRAFELVVRQTEFGFRPTGSAAGWATGDWIIEQLEAAGWIAETQVFSYQGVTVRNIVGKSAGNGEKPVVILGAHYDTRRKADQDPDTPEEPVMGANDGASGTAVLLELAASLELGKIPYQVWLAFFDAEDNGNLDGWDWIVGSTYMASQLTIDPEFVIVVDMVGDRSQEIFYERNSDPELLMEIWSVAASLGYDDAFIAAYRYAILDDHIPFARLGIPVVDIIDFDYPYWHTTGDTIDKVDETSLERVGRTLETYLENPQTREENDE